MKIDKVLGYSLSSPYGNSNELGSSAGVKSVGIVEVHTGNGIVGYGETYSGVYVPELIGPTVETIGRLIVGLDASDMESINKALDVPFVTMTGYLKSVISAIEIAIWDIAGKFQEKPISDILTNRIESHDTKLYASSGSSILPPEQITCDVKNVISKGFTAYKMRVGYKDWTEDLKRVEAARLALDNGNLMVDCIMGTLNKWDLKTAISRIKELEQFNPTWIEEPLHPSMIHDLVVLKENAEIPVAMGESLCGPFEFDTYFDLNLIDIIQPDVTHCGGFAVAQGVISKAKDMDLSVALHNWGGAISSQASLQLAKDVGVDWVEVPMIRLKMVDDFKKEKFGLGVSVTDDMKSKYKLVKGSGYKI